MEKKKGIKNPQTVQDVEYNLNIIKERLEEYKKEQKNKRAVNVYSAIGINTQEIRHSAFLAWLFRSDESHGFQNEALSLFLQEVAKYDYRGAAPNGYKNNKQILSNGGIDIQNIDRYLGPTSVVVEKHYKAITTRNSNIDILIEIKSTKTVIVIENKVLSPVHSDQLRRYEQELDKPENGYADYNRIFVFLTPDGDLPYNKGGDDAYNPKWCILDYSVISKICEKLIKKLSKTQDERKIKLALEDYKEVMDINILKKDSDINKLLREITREFPTEVELLKDYTDNIGEVLKYCKTRLQKEMPGLKIDFKDNAKSFTFYTPTMEAYFKKKGEAITKKKCRWYFGSNGAIVSCVLLDKPDTGWDNAQQEIIQDDTVSQSMCKLTELLSWEQRERPFDEIKSDLDIALNEAIKKLKDFDVDLG